MIRGRLREDGRPGHDAARRAGTRLVLAAALAMVMGLVGFAGTTTNGVCTPASVLVNDSTTVSVTVTDAGGAHNPTGDVTLASSGSGSFADSSLTLTPGAAGVSTCSTSYTPTGAAADTETHTISLSYPGDGTSDPSTGSCAVTVNKRPCNVSVTLSANSAFANETISVTVTVNDASAPPSNVPTGTVHFTSSNAGQFSSTTATLVGGTCTVNYTPTDPCAMSHNITAAYAGSGVHLAANGSASLNIKKRQTQIDMALSGSGPYSITATVKDTSDGTKVTPQGTVDWAYQGGTPATGHVSPASSTLDGSGNATTTYIVDDANAFLHAVTATFTPSGCVHAGSANYVTIQKTPPTGYCWDAGLAILIINNVVFALNLASDIVGVIPDFDFGDPIAFSLKAVAYGLSFDLEYDGIPAIMEGIMGLSAVSGDTDDDGLGDGEELDLANGMYSSDLLPCSCPNPKFADSDRDGLLDGDELYLYQTQMCTADTDGDSLVDGVEVDTWGYSDARDHSNPLEVDTDGDGLDDVQEIAEGCTGGADGYVNCADSDGDGLQDGMDTNANLVSAASRVGTKYVGTPGQTPYATTLAGSGDNEELAADALDSIGDPDSDGDGLSDGVETQMGLNPLDWDSDNDGRCDGDEVLGMGPIPTDPTDPDTDDDGLLDSAEVFGSNPTNPVVADTDGDGLCDGGSRTPSHTGTCALCTAGIGGHPNPQGFGEDEDGDGSLDVLSETNPNQPDTDADGVGDGIEKLGFSTSRQAMIPAADLFGRATNVTYPSCGCMNPLNSDTDGDSLFDGYEDANHDGNFDFLPSDFDRGPGVPIPSPRETSPCDPDTDHDGLPDYQERFQPNPASFFPSNPTNPLDHDTDNDWLSDGAEVHWTCVAPSFNLDPNADGVDEYVTMTALGGVLDPTNPDSDADGYIDGLDPNPCWSEPILIAVPHGAFPLDTDGDGYGDMDEVAAGTDPLNPNDHPVALVVDLDQDAATTDRLWLEDPNKDGVAESIVLDIKSDTLVDARIAVIAARDVERGDFDGDGATDDVRYTVRYVVMNTRYGQTILRITVMDLDGNVTPDSASLTSG
ncbi:MAG: hypothetical protein NTX23_05515 [Candidatus Bipolaricaulota bacterium]|nr:hypothetical protein [Candidatus Bipolaricaulota bacterium]